MFGQSILSFDFFGDAGGIAGGIVLSSVGKIFSDCFEIASFNTVASIVVLSSICVNILGFI